MMNGRNSGVSCGCCLFLRSCCSIRPDANGNVTSTGGKTFAYDSENHLVSMAASGKSAGIIYDWDGNRVARMVNGITTLYLVDEPNPTGRHKS